jgi:hypothetical protein
LEQIGKTILVMGIILVVIGAVVWLFGNKLTWFGNLPGDIKLEKENVKFYAPLVSMLLVSIGISLLLWLVRKFWN